MFRYSYILLFLMGCSSVPDHVAPIQDFELNRYLGKWYEIARLDHRFERGLDQVTAFYNKNTNEQVAVINLGRDKNGNYKSAKGIAQYDGLKKQGFFKVSFFRPFYSPYVIFYIDPDYQYAFVSGPSRHYLWLLSRTPSIPNSVKQQFVTMANSLGFATNDLIWVQQD